MTAVRPGPYKITYRVAAGLNGKAKAVRWSATIPSRGCSRARSPTRRPKTRIADDGKTVVEGTR